MKYFRIKEYVYGNQRICILFKQSQEINHRCMAFGQLPWPYTETKKNE